jgi:hypothetical protein
VPNSQAAFPVVKTLTSPPMSPYTPNGNQPWIEVFLRDNGTLPYTIVSNVTYLSASNAQGTLASTGSGAVSDARSILSVEWSAAPSGNSMAALTITGASASATVLVPINNNAVPADFHGHVEDGGVVSMEAEHFDSTASSSAAYVVVPDYGRTFSGVKLPPTYPSQSPAKGPVLVYPVYTFSSATNASLTVYFSPSENSNPVSPNRFSVSMDGAAPITVQPVPLANAGAEPSGWSDGVIAGAYVKSVRLGGLPAGKHVLSVWLLEPTMVLTKLVLDVGGLKDSLLGPPESSMV